MTTAYFAGRLWAGTDDTVVENAALVVDGSRIVAVGTAAEIESTLPESADRVQLGAATVIPGLIDAHVHLQFPLRGSGDFLLSLNEPLEFTVLKAARNAQVYLAAGFTTVFDCGCRGNLAVALREAIDRGLAVGSRVVASGLPLSPTAGWADEYAPFVTNSEPQGEIADTTDEWIRAVRRQIKQGVDNVKIGISGSSLNPYSRGDTVDMTEADIATVVDVAHRGRVRVAAHCDPAAGLRAAIRAGVDTIHHGKGMDDECRELLRQSECFYVPTVMKYQALVDDGARYGRPAEALAEFAAGLEVFRASVADSIAAGLADRMAAGSDAGNLPPSHGSTVREIELFVELGMSPFQALRSATSVAARAVGRDDVGSLQPGRLADFVVVDGDPFADLAVLRDRSRLTGVYQGGRLAAERGVVAGPDLEADPSNRPLFARRRQR